MVQAIVNISEEANYVINLIKAKYSLKDKSQAIDRLAEEYGRECMRLELKPGYVEKLRRYEKGKRIKVKNAGEYFAAMR